MRRGAGLQHARWLLTAAVVVVGAPGCSAATGGDPCLPPPLQLSASTVRAGEQVTVSSGPLTCDADHTGGWTYTLWLKSGGDPSVQVGEVQVPVDGAFSSALTVPVSTPVGETSLYVDGSLYDQPCNDGESSCAAYTALLTIAA